MKRIVNEVEMELAEGANMTVSQATDRLLVKTPEGTFSALASTVGDTTYVSYKGRQYKVEKATRSRALKSAGNGETHAPMPGLIVEVFVQAGQSVVKGDKLVVLEAMKTQQTFTAAFDGTVSEAPVGAGEQVVEGQLLVKVEVPS
ncbi:MAG: biotin/lipoyl-binding protein [Fimbriimonadaceae bacterium]|nr:biotin/lipoyl-binding protein [Fimbriimonadaceae bacterium]